MPYHQLKFHRLLVFSIDPLFQVHDFSVHSHFVSYSNLLRVYFFYLKIFTRIENYGASQISSFTFSVCIQSNQQNFFSFTKLNCCSFFFLKRQLVHYSTMLFNEGIRHVACCVLQTKSRPKQIFVLVVGLASAIFY